MGRRKARKALKPNKVLKMGNLETTFKCLFCSAGSNSMEVKIETVGVDRCGGKKLTGKIYCFNCNAAYCTTANRLTEPVDIYHEWLDECQRVNSACQDRNMSKTRIASYLAP